MGHQIGRVILITTIFQRFRISLMVMYFGCSFFACHGQKENKTLFHPEVRLIVAGIAQDAGYPQINCQESCCENAYLEEPIYVSSLGIIIGDVYYLFDATPDIKHQINLIHDKFPETTGKLPAGIFLTHAHIGHYTGLMDLGREATNAKEISVYAMPRMANFLRENGPWSQLVSLKNINIQEIKAGQPVSLQNTVEVLSFLVPHRDEYSETVGYKIIGQEKEVLFIPDIDKWSKWEMDIVKEVEAADYSFLDGTFFDIDELPSRNIDEIPHPFIIESKQTFQSLSHEKKKSIFFIHFNHTNPLLFENSEASKATLKEGFNIARQGLSWKI